MARYFDDFTAYGTGSWTTNASWQRRIVATSTTTSFPADADGVAGRSLRIVGATNNGSRVLSFTPAGSTANADILVKVEMNAANTTTGGRRGIAYVRYAGTTEATTKGYAFYSGTFASSRAVGIVEDSTGATVDYQAFNQAANTWYWVRLQATGTTIRAKIWTGAVTSEPASWTVSGTNSTMTAAGYHGVGTFNTGTVNYGWFSIGTNGDTPPVPINDVVRNQVGNVRIEATTDQDQLGNVRVSQTVDTTQIGNVRITAQTSHAQQGNVNIRATTDRTQSGNVRITQTTTRTQQGNVRITAVVDRTQQGNVRIQRTVDTTQVGNVRITASVLRTQQGNVRVTATTTRNQLGSVWIGEPPTLKPQIGNVRILRVEDKTQVGNVRIQKTNTYDQIGNVRILKVVSRDQVGNVSIFKTIDRTQVGNVRIQRTATYNQVGNVRIQRVNTYDQIGNVRITQTTTRDQVGNVSIDGAKQKHQIGNVRIQRTEDQSISGNVRISQVYSRTQVGNVRILRTEIRSQIGNIRVQRTETRDQIGSVVIAREYFKDQIGNVRIVKGRDYRIKPVVEIESEKPQVGSHTTRPVGTAETITQIGASEKIKPILMIESYESDYTDTTVLTDDPVALADDPFALAGQLIEVGSKPDALRAIVEQGNIDVVKEKVDSWQISQPTTPALQTSTETKPSPQITTQRVTIKSIEKLKPLLNE